MFKSLELECIKCRTTFSLTNLYNCSKCGGILTVKYNESIYKLKNNKLAIDKSIQGL